MDEFEVRKSDGPGDQPCVMRPRRLRADGNETESPHDAARHRKLLHEVPGCVRDTCTRWVHTGDGGAWVMVGPG